MGTEAPPATENSVPHAPASSGTSIRGSPIPMPAHTAQRSHVNAEDMSRYTAIQSMAWDQSSDWVKVYVMDLEGVASIPRDSISCTFTGSSFDLRIHGLNNLDLRLFKDNLDKSID